MPDSLAGRDILGRGRTGSGKTVAFALPLVARLAGDPQATKPGSPRGLVLVPTRELATQVDATLAPLANAMGMRTRVIFGGVGQGPQVTALKSGVDIIVATPGRLADLVNQGHAKLGSIAVTVIDEADHMADLGFLPVVRRLLDLTPQGQRLLFSATLDAAVDVLARRYLQQPVTHSVDSATSAVPAMAHHVFGVSEGDRAAVVAELLGGTGRSLAFTRTKHQARKWAKSLTAAGIPAVDLHGNLSQGARERNLGAFASGQVRVLVATDIAARGIHVDDISLVVHVDPPAEHKAYLHRSGRTARAGAEGVVVTIGTTAQRADITAMMRRAAIHPTEHQVRPGSPAISAISGQPAPLVAPAPAAAAAAPQGHRPPTARSRRTGSQPAAPREATSSGRRRSTPTTPAQAKSAAARPEPVSAGRAPGRPAVSRRATRG